MNFLGQVKDFSTYRVSRLIVELLGRVSDERLIQLTHLGEKLASDEEVLGAIRGVRNLLMNPTHPAQKMFYKVLDYFPPKTGRLCSISERWRGQNCHGAMKL